MALYIGKVHSDEPEETRLRSGWGSLVLVTEHGPANKLETAYAFLIGISTFKEFHETFDRVGLQDKPNYHERGTNGQAFRELSREVEELFQGRRLILAGMTVAKHFNLRRAKYLEWSRRGETQLAVIPIPNVRNPAWRDCRLQRDTGNFLRREIIKARQHYMPGRYPPSRHVLG